MSTSDRLDEITARCNAATDGPWAIWHSGTDYPQSVVANDDGLSLVAETFTSPKYPAADAEFIAHARADVPWLVEQVRKRDTALQAVLDLHKAHAEQVLATDCSAETCDCEDGCQTVPIKVCEHCIDLGNSAHHYAYEEGGIETVIWPCPTVRAIEDALGKES